MEGEPMRLLGAHEIRELLGVCRQRVYQLASRADFPKPVAVLAQGKIWLRDDVEEWMARQPPRVAQGTRRQPFDEAIRELSSDCLRVAAGR
ncbi:helix-turn-helix transcriptional regulator [Actinoplanes sp. CA-030573]|uniref:helix-turn-helix transcriptional regulator n=1 Tax=Actinoplanes sp. CA-030573 TaxID=3239898 RepID=UPI003D8A2491